MVGRLIDPSGEVLTKHIQGYADAVYESARFCAMATLVDSREFCPICGDEELCERPADCPELFYRNCYVTGTESKAVA